ncbi:MAG: AAA family ATPase [Bacteroidales bacterium]|jgi:nucleoside-triphosphatase THEP1|nr:AAA family ATPase [Bacteroidales bacterium]
MDTVTTNQQFELAAGFIQFTNRHVYLTGKAGTGKTTFLKNLPNLTSKHHVVVAPTGVAAINAGGVTIHSFFQFSFGPQLPEAALQALSSNPQAAQPAYEARYQRFTRDKIRLIKRLDLLVIDEISMVRADLLDAIDRVLRRFRRRDLPFGGVQLLMIGDIQQLAPVAREEEWQLLRPYYDSVYFFSSHALKASDYVTIELKHIYRQQDQYFIDILNRIRDNQLDKPTLEKLNSRYHPDFDPDEKEGYITLTTHNYQSDQINQLKLKQLKGKSWIFKATVEGEFPEMAYPADEQLELKVGAQVMFVKNDLSPEKRFYNGKIGRLIAREEDKLVVQCDDETIDVEPLTWHNMKYQLDEKTQQIEEVVIGSFKQYPLKLAWAITIHKSQGLTFEKVIIDANAAFAHGQVYVALSRCTSFEGVVLKSRLQPRGIGADAAVSGFLHEIPNRSPDEAGLEEAKRAYEFNLLLELFDFQPLLRLLRIIYKIANENSGSIQTAYLALVSKAIDKLNELENVSQRFRPQLRQLFNASDNPEQNHALQERVKKAADYFLEQLKSLTKQDFTVETDNKQVRKRFTGLEEQVDEQLRVKVATLRQSKEGFETKAYLKTRNDAALGKAVKTFGKAKQEAAVEYHKPLFESLKRWRNMRAMDDDLEHYRVITIKSMQEIAAKLPVSMIELKAINGIGKRKLAAYGQELLALVVEYVGKENIDKSITENAESTVGKQKQTKGATYAITLEHLLAGKSMEETAELRGFAVSTIEGHAARLIKEGKLQALQLVEEKKLNLISEYFLETEDPRLGPAKEVLGEEVSFGELRLVLSQLIHDEKLEPWQGEYGSE